MNIVAQIISALFIFFVAYKYFEYHPEYRSMVDIDKLLPYFFSISIIALIVYFWHNRNIHVKNKFFSYKISVIYVFLISVFVVANTLFLNLNIFPKNGVGGLPDVQQPFNIVTANIGMMTKVAYLLFALTILFLVGYILGDFLMKFLKLKEKIDFAYVVKSTLVGWVIFMQILFLIGIFKLLNIYFLWAVVILIIIFGYKSIIELWKNFFMDFYIVKLDIWGIIALSILYFFVSLNFLEVIRPIPIGWDDMGVYINIPNLISQYGALVKGSYINFHLFESLGFIMFKWTTVALQIAWFVGIFAVFGFIILLRFISNENIAIMLSTLWYSIPGVVFQSSKDMKTDFPMLAFLILAFYLYLIFVKTYKWQYLFLVGMVLGGALFIKPTALVMLMIISLFVLWKYFDIKGILTGLGFMMVLIVKANLFTYGQTIVSDDFLNIFKYLGFVLFVYGFIWILTDKSNVSKLKELLFFPLGIYLGCVITITFNAGYLIYTNQNITSLQALLANPATHDYQKEPITKFDISKLPPDLTLPKEAQNVKATGGYEELGRYIGFHESCEKDPYSFACLWDKHITIPWNITMNLYSKGQYLDITPFFYAVGVVMFLFIIYLYFRFKKENILYEKDFDIKPYLFISIIFSVITTVFLMFFSSAIHWYAISFYISTLFIISIGLFYLYQKESHNNVIIYSIIILIFVLFVSNIAHRIERGPHPYFIGYLASAYSGDNDEIFPGNYAVEKLLPGYLGAAKIVNSFDLYENVMYRIGTFIMYFIKQNDTKNIVQDSLLDEFIKLNYDEDYKKTFERLKFFNTKIMIIDLFTPTIDRTPDKSLSKKFVRLVNPENLCITIMLQQKKTKDEIKDICTKVLERLQYGAYAFAIDRSKKGFIDYFLEAGLIKVLAFDPGHGLLLVELL